MAAVVVVGAGVVATVVVATVVVVGNSQLTMYVETPAAGSGASSVVLR